MKFVAISIMVFIASALPSAQAGPPPAHNYVMQDGLEYGYEGALSELDRQAGRAAIQLLMVRYLGERDGRWQVFHKASPEVIIVYECGKPCEFATVYQYVNEQHIRTERFRITPATLAASVFDDVHNGRLQQHLYRRNGKLMAGWVDKTGNMVFSPAPATIKATPAASNPVGPKTAR